MNADITLHAIAFINEADSKLDDIARAAGGLSFLYPDNDDSNALDEAFRAIGEHGPSESLTNILQLYRNITHVSFQHLNNYFQ